MVTAVSDPRSIGVHTYVARLAVALTGLGADYRVAARPEGTELCHFHLANSTRRVVRHAAGQPRFLVTLHDVLPRTRAVRPLHRALIVPLCIKRAGLVIVHSAHAAKMLMELTSIPARRLEVLLHPAPAPSCSDRLQARAALGLEPDGPPLFVMPGTLKAAKLVHETLTALTGFVANGSAQLLLAGQVADERLARRAAAVGARVLRAPGPRTYEQAIAAADVVLCVRADSVGESNGPLLDAIGTGRPSIITDVGSALEVAGASARVVAPTVAGIRAGVQALLDPGERAQRGQAAQRRAAQLTWEASARRHLELFAGLEAR